MLCGGKGPSIHLVIIACETCHPAVMSVWRYLRFVRTEKAPSKLKFVQMGTRSYRRTKSSQEQGAAFTSISQRLTRTFIGRLGENADLYDARTTSAPPIIIT